MRPLPVHALPACITLSAGAPGPSRHATLNFSATKRAKLNIWHDEGVRILKVHRVLRDEHVRPWVFRWHVAFFAHYIADSAGSLGDLRLRLLAELAAVR